MLGIRHYHRCAIDLWQGDITEFAVDAIINAANSELAGGGGVDGAIHRVGGPVIAEECRRIGSCLVGQAVQTSAGLLPATWVIHTVGPVWHGGTSKEQDLLSASIRASLTLAERLGARHVSCPAISTGVYGFPLALAARTSMESLRSFVDGAALATLRRVTFVLFSRDAYEAFAAALAQVFPEEDGSE